MSEPFRLTVAEAASRMRRRSLSPVELIESHIARAKSLEPRLNVWTVLDEAGARAQARRRQEELAQTGPLGPLHGVPIGVKDIYHAVGLKTTACSPILADFVPTYDSTAVYRLRKAGAVIMGKTVTTEWACMDPPPTRNPWNPAHTPGGSSSGSAVGVAACIFPAAMGSQTAGSVLRPASYNGVVGVKPTFGRISRYGVLPVAWSLDTMGFFTRTVSDAAIMLGVLAGHDPKDASSSNNPTRDYRNDLSAALSPPRIGLVRQLFHDRSDPEVRDHAEAAALKLSKAGARVDEVSVSTDFDTLLSAHRIIMSVEAAAVHQADFKARADDYGPKVRGLIEAGLLIPAVAYVQAQRERRRFFKEMQGVVKTYDVLLTPTAGSPAPRDLTTTGDSALQAPWTTIGFPSLTLPSGLSASGLPLGIQLVSAPFTEGRLLASGLWCEQTMDVRLAPPLVR